jgi:hypothetical protein
MMLSYPILFSTLFLGINADRVLGKRPDMLSGLRELESVNRSHTQVRALVLHNILVWRGKGILL